MTPEAQRIEIAKACGWRRIYPRGIDGQPVGWLGELPTSERPHSPGSQPVPNYLTDLNAMHEAEKVLTEEQYSQYAWRVLQGTPANEVECREFFSATAAQRAEAFLRTLNLYTA